MNDELPRFSKTSSKGSRCLFPITASSWKRKMTSVTSIRSRNSPNKEFVSIPYWRRFSMFGQPLPFATSFDGFR